MLQQILRDMWVAPEILSELDETQKQTLFCKMREEQVRRWRIWDQKLIDQELNENLSPSLQSKESRKNVQFLLQDDGEPLVWIMGECDTDLDIIDKEISHFDRTRNLARNDDIRRTVKDDLVKMIEYTEGNEIDKGKILLENLEQIEEIYCSVDEIREKLYNLKTSVNPIDDDNSIKSDDFRDEHKSNNVNNKNYKNNIANFNLIEGREILQELHPNKDFKVSARVALWEKKLVEQQPKDISLTLRDNRIDTAYESEPESAEHLIWMEQKKKAKSAESKIREIARRAREEHKRLSIEKQNIDPPSLVLNNMPPVSNSKDTNKPIDKNAIKDWFVNSERNRGAGLDDNGKPAKWFHGLITRGEAENLLQNCTEGSFLVRLSERIWGYAISYKSTEGCKHYLIDASQNSHYQFFGNSQVTHKTLANLVTYHSKVAISETGKEMLLSPCETTVVPQVMQTC